jgi:hypothetical protein
LSVSESAEPGNTSQRRAFQSVPAAESGERRIQKPGHE